MQTTQHISPSQLDEVIDSVFASGSPVVKQESSDFDSPTKTFPTADDLREDLRFIPDQKQRFKCYAIYYPDAGGTVSERRIDLKPGAVPGHTHRFSQEGWGLIHLQCNQRDYPSIECRVAVNSDVRAHNWSDTCPEMGAPDLWDWDVIKRHAGRLTRLLRKLAKQRAEQNAAGQPAKRPESK